MNASFSRQQRRAMERAAPGVDHITAEDRAWFEARPERQHRIRRMTVAEIAQAEAMGGLARVPVGAARFALVRKVTTNVRLRLFILGPARKNGSETGEEIAAALWEHHRNRSPGAASREDAMTAIAADHDAVRAATGSA